MNFKNRKSKERSYIKEKPHRTLSKFLNRNFSCQKRIGMTFKILKEKHHQPRILYPVKLSFRNKGLKKTSANKQNL